MLSAIPKIRRLSGSLLLVSWTISPPQFPQHRQQQKQKPTIGTMMANKNPIAKTTRNGNSQPLRTCKKNDAVMACHV